MPAVVFLAAAVRSGRKLDGSSFECVFGYPGNQARWLLSSGACVWNRCSHADSSASALSFTCTHSFREMKGQMCIALKLS